MEKATFRMTLCVLCCAAINIASGNMLTFRYLGAVKGPVDGADHKGHAILPERLGELDASGFTPIYAYWSSKDAASSPHLGCGWHIPIAESTIIPMDENRFEMHRPDGRTELIYRLKSDRSKLRGRRYWRGEIDDDEIRIYTTKECRHGACELLFKKGRLTRLKYRKLNATFTYRDRHTISIECNGKEVMRISKKDETDDICEIVFGCGRYAKIKLGNAKFPSASKERTATAVKEMLFSDGERKSFNYGISKDGNGTISTSLGTRITWNPESRKIVSKDDWTYEVKEPTPKWNNVPIRRCNPKGEAEGDYLDLQTGIRTRESGFEKNMMRMFTSGFLRGNVRWDEHYANGKPKIRNEYSYNEKGRIVYIKTMRPVKTGRGWKVLSETWRDGDGNPLKIRYDGDDLKLKEYIYTPDGKNVAILDKGKLVYNSTISNGMDFVEWHRARQRGEDPPVPKIIERPPPPLPQWIKELPPDVLKNLLDDGW